MFVGALVPFDTGGDPDTVREYAQALEAAGYDFLEAPDYVLVANVASRPCWDPDRGTSQDLFHESFVLLSYVHGVAPKLAFSTGVLIMAQRQVALIAKQAACLDLREALRSNGKALPGIDGDECWELPLPATYVTAADRRIVLAAIELDYRNRLAPDAIIASLLSLQPAPLGVA